MQRNVIDQRVRAAWRARACAAAAAAGAQVFCLGAGIAIPLGLNAAWLCALPAAGLSALLAARARAIGQSRRLGRPRALLLSAAMLASCLLLLCAAVSLCTQTLLPQARAIHCALLTLLFVLLAAVPRMQGVSRLCFALRAALPAALFVCALALMPRSAVSGLFPLLGTGADRLIPCAAAMLCAAVPALMLLLPDSSNPAGQLSSAPGAGFFALRVGLGALCGTAMLLLPALFGGYEILRGQNTWGARLRLAAVSGGQKPLWHMALLLAQLSCILTGAAALLCAAEDALSLALPCLARRRRGLLLFAGLLAAALWLLTYAGYETALLAAPLLILPVPLLLPPGRRRTAGKKKQKTNQKENQKENRKGG